MLTITVKYNGETIFEATEDQLRVLMKFGGFAEDDLMKVLSQNTWFGPDFDVHRLAILCT